MNRSLQNRTLPKRTLRRRPRRAMVLLAVMVIVMLVALAAYGFNQQMAEAYRSSRLQSERAQARLTAISGIESLRLAVEQPRGERSTWHRESLDSFVAVPLDPDAEGADEDHPTWMFSVIAPLDPSGQIAPTETSRPWRFGLTNESAKLNLLVLDRWAEIEPGRATEALLNLPGMDRDMAQALLRAHDIHDTMPASATGLGERLAEAAGSPPAGSLSNGSLSNGSLSNGSLSSGSGDAASPGQTDAARWARRWAGGWTGGDYDHNYQLDPLERRLLGEQTSPGQAAAVAPSATAAPPAWRDYLTFDSRQKNVNLAGQPRVFLNGADLPSLHQDLLAIWPAEWANFVIAARQYGLRGQTSSSSGTGVTSAAGWSPDLSIPATARLASGLELVNATVRIPRDNEKPLLLRSPFSDGFGDRSNYIRSLVDDVTVHPSPVIVGQVDVMEAPRPVLLGIPAMTPEIADQIIQRRGAPSGSISAIGTPAGRDTIAWLLLENVVDLPTLLELQPWITVGGDCYHAQIIGFRDPLSPTFRCTVTLDGTAPQVAVRNFRRWDAWGTGFRLDDLRGEPSPTTSFDHAGSPLP